MKVGTINYATRSGLGILTKEFVDSGVVDEILVIKNKSLHNYNWYPNATSIDKNNTPAIEEFIKGIDVLLLFETYFNPNVIPLAKKYNVGVALMPMYECSPQPLNVDLLLTPSDLDYDWYIARHKGRIERINVPAHSKVKFKQKSIAKVFTHNAGNRKFEDRNGTHLLIKSLKYIKSDCKIKIKSQKPISEINDPRVEYIIKDVPFEELWDETDVFIFPERYNGLCLPLQEAYASGCAVIAGDRHPINKWLPHNLLVPSAGSKKHIFPGDGRMEFGVEQYKPEDLAEVIDKVYNQDISLYSLKGKKWGEDNSWEKLKPKYLELLKSINKK